MFRDDSRILVSHPGKYGDIILALPAVLALARHFDTSVDFLTSPFCSGLSDLLKVQPYIANVLLDKDYILEHQHRGYQPHKLQLPLDSGEERSYDFIFDLGYRSEDSYVIEEQPISGYPFYILSEEYGVHLDAPSIQGRDSGVLSLPFSSCEQAPYFVFQGFGETLDLVFGPEQVDRLIIHWVAILKMKKIELKVLTGRREFSRYQRLGIEPILSGDLLSTANYLHASLGFIGVQSVVSAIANELSHPRFVLGVFPNALPDTPNAKVCSLRDLSTEAAEGLSQWINERLP